MKTNYTKLILLALSIILMYGCYDEKEIISSGYQVVKRFDFPQGDTEADQIFKEIYDEHGIMIIYKDFKPEDVDRSWTAPASMGVNGSLSYSMTASSDTALQIAKFYKNQVFDFLKPEISKKMFLYSPEYLYVTLNAHEVNEAFLSFMGIYYEQTFSFGMIFHGMDFWFTGFRPEIYFNEIWEGPETAIWEGVEYPAMYDPGKYTENASYKASLELMKQWFLLAINFGYIVPPEGFQDDVDTITSLSYYATDDNYYTKRGFAPNTSYSSFEGNSMLTSNTSISRVSSPEGDFGYFISSALFFADIYEEYLEGEELQLLRSRYKTTIDYLKTEYDIDLVNLARTVRSLYPNVIIDMDL